MLIYRLNLILHFAYKMSEIRANEKLGWMFLSSLLIVAL